MAKESRADKQARVDRAIKRKIVIKAKSRTRSKVGFMWHFAVFVLANLTIIFINLTYSPAMLWYFWPLGAWGAGLLAHAFAVFMKSGATSAMVEREIERETARRGIKAASE